jgi:hypothetical protein
MVFNAIRRVTGVKILSIYRDVFIQNGSIMKRLDRLSKIAQ